MAMAAAMAAMLLLVVVAASSPASAATVTLVADASRPKHAVSPMLWGVFFEEINHAGTGGLYAELVQNRGFEAGGQAMPSNPYPWQASSAGNVHASIRTERSSPHPRNPVALRTDINSNANNTDVHDDDGDTNIMAGVVNPGFSGMNVVEGEEYTLSMWARAEGHIRELVVYLAATTASERQPLTRTYRHVQCQCLLACCPKGTKSKAITHDLSLCSWGRFAVGSNWKKYAVRLRANASDPRASLVIAAAMPSTPDDSKATFWLDVVSLMPANIPKGHPFRPDLLRLLSSLSPSFLRFPGGCFVESDYLSSSFRWRETVGPIASRPGHINAIWGYFSEDGLGFYEYLVLSEDIGAEPVWVFNAGISHRESVGVGEIGPWVEEVLEGIEFARGDEKETKWGKVRASMGHPSPFPLHHVAVGNEDCFSPSYPALFSIFYRAIKSLHPDMTVISNCYGDDDVTPEADVRDYHIYARPEEMIERAGEFDGVERGKKGKVFVSEYAALGGDAGKGTLRGAVAEAVFMLGLERNSDVVTMASYAPLFTHEQYTVWEPDAIHFDSSRAFGTPSYHLQTMFGKTNFNGSVLLDSTLQWDDDDDHGEEDRLVAASVIVSEREARMVIKLVNYGSEAVNATLRMDGLSLSAIHSSEDATIYMLTSKDPLDTNTLDHPDKVVPKVCKTPFRNNATMVLPSNSVTVISVPLTSSTTTTGQLGREVM
eukprot:jgi/Chlat1/4984/Chrsp32S04961